MLDPTFTIIWRNKISKHMRIFQLIFLLRHHYLTLSIVIIKAESPINFLFGFGWSVISPNEWPFVVYLHSIGIPCRSFLLSKTLKFVNPPSALEMFFFYLQQFLVCIFLFFSKNRLNKTGKLLPCCYFVFYAILRPWEHGTIAPWHDQNL